MRAPTFLMASLAALVFAGCGDKGDDTATTAEAGADTDADVQVTDPTANCGSAGAEELQLSSPSASEVDVVHISFAEGCCPEYLLVSTEVDEDAMEITATYELGPDPCDCICMLDATYSLENVPTGTWTIQAGAASESIEID